MFGILFIYFFSKEIHIFILEGSIKLLREITAN